MLLPLSRLHEEFRLASVLRQNKIKRRRDLLERRWRLPMRVLHDFFPDLILTSFAFTSSRTHDCSSQSVKCSIHEDPTVTHPGFGCPSSSMVYGHGQTLCFLFAEDTSLFCSLLSGLNISKCNIRMVGDGEFWKTEFRPEILDDSFQLGHV